MQLTNFTNRVTRLLNIQLPIIQAGMVWASGWKLASAVSNAGGLGIIGLGSMYPEVLRQHIINCKNATSKPFAVNLPLLYPGIQQHIQVITSQKVPIVFTSAGSPKLYTTLLKDQGITVVHVVSSSEFAIKAEAAGCDAVVAEGFEAGGHNGRNETTTLVLVPLVSGAVAIPVIAAGGIATGRQMFASMILGAEGVQLGSRFVCTPEASSHIHFKQLACNAGEGATALTMKGVMPVRLLKNTFYESIAKAEQQGATPDEIRRLLGSGRAKKGMFEGDLQEGELEIGQSSALIHAIKPAAEIVNELWQDFRFAMANPLLHGNYGQI